jgi:putative Holliday junction resolvase
MAVCNLSELPIFIKKDYCLLGLDPGSTVIGVAVSDPGLVVASPLTTITRKKFADDAAALVTLIRERRIGGIIIGLPKNMDGSEGPSAQSARAFARNLLQRGNLPDPDIPVVFWDERMSSAAIERFLIEEDMTRKRRDAVIDKTAAAYILQGALDALHYKKAENR